VDEPESSAADEPEAPPADKPDEPVADEPGASAAEEPEASPPDEPEALTVDQPEASTADEPEAPIVDEPEASDEPDTPAADEPKAPTAVEPEAPPADKPDEPVADEPEAFIAEEPEKPADEPEVLRADEPEESVANEPEASVAATQMVIIRRAFNISPVLACRKDGRGMGLGAELTKQIVTPRRTIAERNLLSMQVISINKQSAAATSAAQALLPEVMVQEHVASERAEPAEKYWPVGQVVAVFVEQDVAALVLALKSVAAQAEHINSSS
jgi:hypothetical protein